MSSTLHLLPLIYPLFTCVDPDPYSENRSESTKDLNTDPFWIRIHKTGPSRTEKTVADCLFYDAEESKGTGRYLAFLATVGTYSKTEDLELSLP